LLEYYYKTGNTGDCTILLENIDIVQICRNMMHSDLWGLTMKNIKIFLVVSLLALFPISAFAWETVESADIREFLDETKILYSDNSWNILRKSGKTTYNDGQTSTGRWKLIKGRFCSKYGSNQWSCYEVQQEDGGKSVRFISDDDGRIWTGKFVE